MHVHGLYVQLKFWRKYNKTLRVHVYNICYIMCINVCINYTRTHAVIQMHAVGRYMGVVLNYSAARTLKSIQTTAAQLLLHSRDVLGVLPCGDDGAPCVVRAIILN